MSAGGGTEQGVEDDRDALTGTDGTHGADQDDLDDRDGEAGHRPASLLARRKVLVFSAAALAVLLVGAAIGMLLTLTAVGSNAPPGEGSVDVGFAQDMQVHHLQAVTLANWERDHTADLSVKQLAFDIEQTQLGQVGSMSGWLTLWGQPELPTSGTHMTWMAETGGHGHSGSASPSGGVALMPGMATSAEITRMRTLTGRDLDVYFLQLMLRHHQGGLEMAEYATKYAETGVVRNLADKIVKGQTSEVTFMTQLLAERGAKPLP